MTHRISHPLSYRAAIREMLDTEGPYLLDVMVPHIQVGSCVCCTPLLLKHRSYGVTRWCGWELLPWCPTSRCAELGLCHS